MEARATLYLDSSVNPGRALLCRVPGADQIPGDLPISAIQITFATATAGLATIPTLTCAKFFGVQHASLARDCARYELILRRTQ